MVAKTAFPSRKPSVGALTLLSRYGTVIAFALLIAFNALFTPNFLSLQTLNVNLTQVATIVIVATGMTLVVATGGIDLSVGSLMAIAGALAPMIFLGQLGTGTGWASLVLAFIAPLVVVMLLGWFNGWFITRFKVQPIVATMVLFIAGRGIAQVATNGNLQVFRNDTFQFIGLGHVLGIPVQVLMMAIVVISADALIRKTVLGCQILAVGGNERAALLSGVRASRVKCFVYIVSAALAGLAGLIVVARNSASDANLVGLGMELDAIAAVAVGGTLLSGGKAQIYGTLLGACVIQLVRYTLLANGVPDAAALIVKAGLIATAVLIQQRSRHS